MAIFIGCYWFYFFGGFVADLTAEFGKPQEITGYMEIILRWGQGHSEVAQVKVDIYHVFHLKRVRRQR